MIRHCACLFVLMFGLGSEVGYLWQLAKGQVALLWKAKPIDEVIAKGNLSDDQREKLELVQAIRLFARNEIGLETSQNYTTFVDIGSGPVSWNLVVCPKDKLEPLRWSYPVVGTVPYRGYFDRDKAQKARDEFDAKGYDTYLRPVSAYSTLGWFSDPILSTMLRYSEGTLADLIIHELTHATVWIEDDATFNESLASFVGETGALLWLVTKYGEQSDAVQLVVAGREDGAVFRKFMHGISTRLDSLYQLEMPLPETLAKREEIFQSARLQFESLPLKTDFYSHFPSWQLNNARVALYRVYQERTDIFARVHRACGDDLRTTVDVLRDAEQAPNPGQWLEDWLESRDEKHTD